MAGAITHIMELSYECSGACTKMRFVKLTGNQTVLTCAAITDKALGVIDVDVSVSEAAAGKGVAVVTEGVVWVEAAAAIAQDAFVAPSANGRAQTGVSTQFVAGRALKAAASAGDLIPVLLQRSDRALP